ncbi:hypothetical protein ACROYT_G018976 [Oculina patagonica]
MDAVAIDHMDAVSTKSKQSVHCRQSKSVSYSKDVSRPLNLFAYVGTMMKTIVILMLAFMTCVLAGPRPDIEVKDGGVCSCDSSFECSVDVCASPFNPPCPDGLTCQPCSCSCLSRNNCWFPKSEEALTVAMKTIVILMLASLACVLAGPLEIVPYPGEDNCNVCDHPLCTTEIKIDICAILPPCQPGFVCEPCRCDCLNRDCKKEKASR